MSMSGEWKSVMWLEKGALYEWKLSRDESWGGGLLLTHANREATLHLLLPAKDESACSLVGTWPRLIFELLLAFFSLTAEMILNWHSIMVIVLVLFIDDKNKHKMGILVIMQSFVSSLKNS